MLLSLFTFEVSPSMLLSLFTLEVSPSRFLSLFTYEVSPPSRLLYLPSRFRPQGYHYLPMRFRPQGCYKIRAKIWSEEYIDFGTLIANPELFLFISLTVSNLNFLV